MAIKFKESYIICAKNGLDKYKNCIGYNKINLIKPGICCKQDIINDILNSLVKLTSVQRIKLAQQRQAIKKLIKIRLIKSRIYGNKLNPIY